MNEDLEIATIYTQSLFTTSNKANNWCGNKLFRPCCLQKLSNELKKKSTLYFDNKNN